MDSKNDGLFFSFRSYMIAMYIQAAIGVIILILCIRKSNRIFRTRYYVFLIMAAIYISAEILKYSFSLPIWMLCIVYNIISAVCLYFTGVFSRNRLREWSLDSFANDMSDGLILYDNHNDLIHINDMIRNNLGEKLIEDFKDRKPTALAYIGFVKELGNLQLLEDRENLILGLFKRSVLV